MSLWIEEVAQRYLSQFDAKHVPFKERMALLRKGGTTKHLKQEMLERMFRQDAARKLWVEPKRDLSPAEIDRGEADLRRRMAPFILPELAHIPIALDVDPAVVHGFAGAEVKPSVTDFSEGLLSDWRSTYLDFSPGSAKLEGDWFVRAVLVSQETSELSKWSAVIQEPSSSQVMILTWYRQRNVGCMFGNLIGHDDAFSQFSSCPRWVQFTTDLVDLCAAWFATMRGSANGASFRGENGDAPPNGEPQSAVPACSSPSRFRRVRLTPNGLRSAMWGDGSNSIELSRHIRVRGHFKFVRYGKGWEFGRLQWIRSYEKGPRHQPLETRVALFNVEAAA